MKTRTGFVSNSSSSSFVIRKRDLTCEQLDKLKKHGDLCDHDYDVWKISEDGDWFEFSVSMDNFDLEKYAHKTVGVSRDHIFQYKD